MRKHLFLALMLTAGAGIGSQAYAAAAPEPQSQSQGVVTIKGTVLDENNEPVIGASVTPKGQTRGVATDAFGNFTIAVKPGTPLTVNFVGYKAETMAAANDMTIYLQPTTETIN